MTEKTGLTGEVREHMQPVDPLGALALDRSRTHGSNLHQAARELEAQIAPPDTLAPAVKAARLKLDKSKAALCAAEEALNGELADSNRYHQLLRDLETKTRLLQNDKT